MARDGVDSGYHRHRMRSDLSLQMPEFNIVVPDMFALLEPLRDSDPRRAARFAEIIGRADHAARGHDDECAEMLRLLGAESHPVVPMPPASLTYAHDIGTEPETRVLRADPVHLRADPSRLVLFAPRHLEVTPTEGDQLIGALNDVYAEQDLNFLRGASPERWYIAGAGLPELLAPSPSSLDGETLEPDRQSRRQMGVLQTIWTEIQMLFHDHPVNEARVGKHKPAINSVWFWGGGDVTIPRGLQDIAIATDDDELWTAAASCGVGQRVELVALIEETAPAMVVLRNPDHATCDQLCDALENGLRRLRRGRIEAVTLSDRNQRFRLTNSNRWRVWRRASGFWAYRQPHLREN